MNSKLEQVLLDFYKNEMISFLNSHPEYFEEAISLALSEKQPFAWRSAWLLSHCMKNNDKRIRPHIKKIISVIPEKDRGHQRSLLRILFEMKLNDDQEGRLFDICMTIWEEISHSPSVRYTAFLYISETAKKYPELSNEIAFITQNRYLETLSPGIKNAVKRMLK